LSSQKTVRKGFDCPLPRTSIQKQQPLARGLLRGRNLAVLCRKCIRRSCNTEDKMSVERLASFLLFLGPGACFCCQGEKPGKELDLAK
jgi:hypothetical protein